MRKLLLASVCTLGAMGAVAGANAQTPSTGTIGQRPGDVARGMVTTAPTPEVNIANPIQGQLIGKPGAAPGANNNNNAFGTARTGASAVPTPGTLVIHFNSRVTIQWYQGWNSLMGSPTPGTVGTARTSNQMSSWMRLYGGADGMAANGLRYGGAFEVRQNFTRQDGVTVFTPPINAPTSQAGAGTNVQTLYVRRAFVYAGTNELGIIRLGMGDGLITLFDQGRTTNQTYSPTSHFNGSDLGASIGGGTAPPFAFISGSGDEYDTQKLVYLSPNFSGFDFGLMYSPAAGNSLAGCGLNASGCSNLTTSTVPADGARFKDMVAAGVRYSGPIGPVNLLAYGVYSYAGHVAYSGTAAAARAAAGAPAGSTWNGQFDNLNFGSFGAAVTWQGFTLAANGIIGAINGRMAARPSGGAGTAAWLVGVQYAIPGLPMVVGTTYASIDSQGAVAMTGLTQRREYEFDIGGSYTLAPGMVLFADYIYQHRKQSGWNFATGAAGTANNSIQGQGFVFGTQMTW